MEKLIGLLPESEADSSHVYNLFDSFRDDLEDQEVSALLEEALTVLEGFFKNYDKWMSRMSREVNNQESSEPEVVHSFMENLDMENPDLEALKEMVSLDQIFSEFDRTAEFIYGFDPELRARASATIREEAAKLGHQDQISLVEALEIFSYSLEVIRLEQTARLYALKIKILNTQNERLTQLNHLEHQFQQEKKLPGLTDLDEENEEIEDLQYSVDILEMLNSMLEVYLGELKQDPEDDEVLEEDSMDQSSDFSSRKSRQSAKKAKSKKKAARKARKKNRKR